MEIEQFADPVEGKDVISKLKLIYEDAVAKKAPVINLTSDPHLLGADGIKDIIESKAIPIAVLTRSTRDKEFTYFLEQHTAYFLIRRKDFHINFQCHRNPNYTEEVYASPYNFMYLYPHSNVDPTEKHLGYFISRPELVKPCYNQALSIIEPLIEHERFLVDKVRTLDSFVRELCESNINQ